MIDNFKQFIRTTQDVRVLQEELTSLKQSLFERHGDQDGFVEALRQRVRIQVAQVILEVLASKTVTKERLLEELEAYLHTRQSIQLNLPLQPSEGFVERLFDWAQANLGEEYVLDLVSDRQLLAGVVIVHKGRYLDYSLNNQISTLLPGRVAEAYAAISRAS